MTTEPNRGLDNTELDPADQCYCSKGIAESTHKTYQSALCNFAQFCSTCSLISLFPVSVSVMLFCFISGMPKPVTSDHHNVSYSSETYADHIRIMKN